MIKKLRIKFIIIAMLSVLVVLGSIVTAINVTNYRSVSDFADKVLNELYDRGGTFFTEGTTENPTDNGAETPPPPPDGSNGQPPKKEDFGRETFFEARYFSVDYSSGNAVAKTDRISLSESEALDVSSGILASKRTRGYYGNYRFSVENGGTLVLCVDCSRNLSTAGYFLRSSLIISAVGYVCVFILVFIFSATTFKPVAESYDKQKKFITDAEHELKTPITIISANNELIEMENGETESTRAIAKQVNRLSSMVKNLVSLARLDETEKLANASEFSVSDVANECFGALSPAVKAQGKEFTAEIDDGVSFYGDKNLIARLFTIIGENACKYSRSYVFASLTKKNKGFALTVKNDADGIADGKLNRIFDRFYRSETSRASGIEGSGIGLSVAKEIVSLHKGDIKATGENGVFTIKIIL